jgi:hypothetical protein
MAGKEEILRWLAGKRKRFYDGWQVRKRFYDGWQVMKRFYND